MLLSSDLSWTWVVCPTLCRSSAGLRPSDKVKFFKELHEFPTTAGGLRIQNAVERRLFFELIGGNDWAQLSKLSANKERQK
jgi:hypothetical protein